MNVKERFEKYIELIPFTTCWIWNGSLNKKGYGCFWANNTRFRANRFSYTLYKGEIPEGMFVCHSCDNPSCVNPEHLWLGTPKDNVQDMIKKGRSHYSRGSRKHCKQHGNHSGKHYNHPKGEKHYSSKLTEQQVKEIRLKYKPFEYSPYRLAEEYNVSCQSIKKIVKRQTWKHI